MQHLNWMKRRNKRWSQQEKYIMYAQKKNYINSEQKGKQRTPVHGWIIVIAARQTQSTDFPTKISCTLFSFSSVPRNLLKIEFILLAVPLCDAAECAQKKSGEKNWKKRRRCRAKRKWFMTFHMKQNTHSNVFLFDAHERAQHKYFVFVSARGCLQLHEN